MKTFLAPLLSIAIGVTFAAGACEYLSRLNARTQLLENRLILLENAAIAPKSPAPAPLVVRQLLAPPPPVARYLPATDQSSLEARVAKLEQALKPHLEYLSKPR
jgi:hypothetical protein